MSTRGLLPYQARWIQDDAGLAVIEKSRRIGLSWSEAYEDVMHTSQGLGDVYYQSYNKDMTRGFISDCAEWARVLQVGAEAVGETILDDGSDDGIQAFRMRLASGKHITAMTSAPRGFRSAGRPGDKAVIDEAAFVDDLDEVLKAAMAFRVWGGTVRIMSTHNGEASPFAALVRDMREGVRPGSLHTVTLRQALSEGLYRRICEVSGQRWSADAEAQWEADLRAEYGTSAAEELDCIPAAGSGAWLSWEIIRAAEDAAAGFPDLYKDGATWLGIDVARRVNLWVAVVLEQVGDVLWTRELVVHQNIPFTDQYDEVGRLDRTYRPTRIAVDQGGMGEAVVEELQRRYGSRVEGVLLNGPRRLDVATALRERLEDRRLRLPAEQAVRNDLHAVRAEKGPGDTTRLRADAKDTDGHADRFWAYALACGAAAGPQSGPPEHEVVVASDLAAGLDEFSPRGAGIFAGYV